MAGLALMVISQKKLWIVALFYVHTVDYSTTFEVFFRFHLNLYYRLYVEASHIMQKYDQKIIAFTQRSNSNFLVFLEDDFKNLIFHELEELLA